MKKVGVSKTMYLLCRELERLEDELNFTVFYPFAEILDSHHFCPAFDFEGVYYEVQYSDKDYLQLLDFGRRGHKEIGDILTEKEILELIEKLKSYEK